MKDRPFDSSEERRAHNKAKPGPKLEQVITHYEDRLSLGETIFASNFPLSGTVNDIEIEIEKLEMPNSEDTPDPQIIVRVKRLSKNQTVSKENKLVAGRNNLGDFEVDKGDRLKITTKGEGNITGIWLNAVFTS